MPNTINKDNIIAFPSVRANEKNYRSFTEQNVANLISHLFIDMSNGNKEGFSVCEHEVSSNSWVLFNLGGRFFDVKKSDLSITSGSDLYVGIIVDNSTQEILGGIDNGNYKGLYFGSSNDVSSCTHKIKLYDNSTQNKLVNQIHLYTGESNDSNAYQTKSQLDNTYAPKTNSTVYATQTDVTNLTNTVTSLTNLVTNIDTIDGGTIS